jgi:hypothetical protein
MNSKVRFGTSALVACSIAAIAACGEPAADGTADAADDDAGGRPVRDVGPIERDTDGASSDVQTGDDGNDGAAIDASTDDDADAADDTAGDIDGGAEDIAANDVLDEAPDGDSGLAIGQPCTDSDQCASNLCVDTTAGAEPGICSIACDDLGDCPENFECYQLTLDGVAVLGVCLPDAYCSDPDDDGYGKGPGCIAEDCDEDSSEINAGALELCDNLDNDCDGETDEGIEGLGAACDTGLAGLCGLGSDVCAGGEIVCEQSYDASTETCDGLDNDCDGSPDDGLDCDPLPECDRVYGGYRCASAGTFALPIPAGVDDVIVISWGGGGAGGNQGDGTGGGGGYVFAGGLLMDGPTTLRAVVGEGGTAVGGGGGASYVYWDDLLLTIAAGGGGGASDGCSGCWGGGAGGAGGGAIGQTGSEPIPRPGVEMYGRSTGGAGGTQSEGGAGGVPYGASTTTDCVAPGLAGSAGTGGDGAGGWPACANAGRGGVLDVGGAGGHGNGSAGGGGAGFYGGGGGGGRYTYWGSGGGGGSSWIHPSAFTAVTEMIAGDRRVPGDAADNVFYLGENAVGGDRGTASDSESAGKDGVVVILMYPPPWL